MNTGHWHCLVCARPVALNVDGTQSLCAQCGSPAVKWIEPKTAHLETPKRQPSLRTSGPAGRPLTPEQTRFHFAQLRAAVERS